MKNYEKYQQAKKELSKIEQWADMLGKPYYGGGGGIGRLHYCNIGTKEHEMPTIYYQWSNGDVNYHKCPVELLPHLNKAIKLNFNTLLSMAIEDAKTAVKDAARSALDEIDKMNKDAMIEEAK